MNEHNHLHTLTTRNLRVRSTTALQHYSKQRPNPVPSLVVRGSINITTRINIAATLAP